MCDNPMCNDPAHYGITEEQRKAICAAEAKKTGKAKKLAAKAERRA